MQEINKKLNDDLSLLNTVKQLSQTSIRASLKVETIQTWLNQFEKNKPEYTLALLILRYMIYRTNEQVEASLEQALRKAALHFCPITSDKKYINWRDILLLETDKRQFTFTQVANEFTPHGSSGEIMMRVLKSKFKIPGSRFSELANRSQIGESEIILIVDDAGYTADSILKVLESFNGAKFKPKSIGIVLAMAHEDCIKNIHAIYPEIEVFYGEQFTSMDSLEAYSISWSNNNLWSHQAVTPIDAYYQVVNSKAQFPGGIYGHRKQELLIAYQHGIPDNSLRLLWDVSDSWTPLIGRYK